MEKSTQKFLSILLSIALIMCFPIAASANQSDDEVFTGTYTAAESARNVLISGSDAAFTVWYEDKVVAGNNTYSVRMNEYGLNLDGNMIEMTTGKTYTVRLAEYGFASFKFTVPADGAYVVTAQNNETYRADYDVAFVNFINEKTGLRERQYHGWSLYKSQYDNYNHWLSTEVSVAHSAGDVLYVVATAYMSRGSDECTFDVRIDPVTQENCPHSFSKNTVAPTCTDNGYTTKVCTICGYTENINATPANGHNYVTTVVAPTYTAAGYTLHKCSVCGYSYTDNPVPALVAPTPAPAPAPTPVQPTAPAAPDSTTAAQPQTPAEKETKPKLPKGYSYSGNEIISSKLKKPSVKKLKKGKKQIKATWKKVSGVKGYQVQVATDKKFKKNKKTVTVKKQKTTSASVKKLKSNKKYYVRVRTYTTKKINGKNVKVYSKWSKVSSVKTKK